MHGRVYVMLILGFNDKSRVVRKTGFLLPKSEPPSHLHRPYSLDYVRPGRKTKVCFFRVVAQVKCS